MVNSIGVTPTPQTSHLAEIELRNPANAQTGGGGGGGAVANHILGLKDGKLRNSTTVDWQVRESVRAKLRILVRRTLKKWKYPPVGEDSAVELVLKQAESLSHVWSQ